jgi:alkylhydroperoxidase family enzyme
MARIPLVEYDAASPDLRALYERITAARGSVLNVYKGIANNPPALAALFELTMATYRSGSLEPRHQELAYLYTSTLNQCHY